MNNPFSEEYNDNIVMNRQHPCGDGVQICFKFNNNYGASVVQNHFSYGGDEGLWELAVIKFDGDKFSINYSTPITDDVIGHLTVGDVSDILWRIKNLKEETNATERD